MSAVVSRPAARRIRTFALASWAVGALVIAAGVGVTAFQLVPALRVPGFEGEAVPQAWTRDDPPAATSDDGGTTWRTTARSAYLDVPAALAGGPIVVTLVAGGSYVSVDLSPTGWSGPGARPSDVGELTTRARSLVVLTAPGSRLWLTSFDEVSGPQPWTVSLAALPATEVSGDVGGQGDRDIRYTGDALSGSLTQSGTGLVAVDVYSLGRRPVTVTGADDTTLSLLWAQGAAPLLRIRSDEGTATWAFRVEAPAGEGRAP